MGRRNRVLTPLARAWKEEAYYIANALAHREGWRVPEPEEKIVLEVIAFWPDGRRRDMNNTHKLLCDALEGAVYLDDKMVLVRDMDFSVDRKRPRLEVCVYVKDD
jgi:crossover junction endodeoxyribonuclease RusA